jgi:hypothetical protein
VRSDGDISDPSRFYIQIDKFLPMLIEISSKIVTPTRLLENPTIGALGLAMYEEDWYRIKVVRIGGVSDVFFK